MKKRHKNNGTSIYGINFYDTRINESYRTRDLTEYRHLFLLKW